MVAVDALRDDAGAIAPYCHRLIHQRVPRGSAVGVTAGQPVQQEGAPDEAEFDCRFFRLDGPLRSECDDHVRLGGE